MKYHKKISGYTVVILTAIALLSTGVYSAIASKTTVEEQSAMRMIPLRIFLGNPSMVGVSRPRELAVDTKLL